MKVKVVIYPYLNHCSLFLLFPSPKYYQSRNFILLLGRNWVLTYSNVLQIRHQDYTFEQRNSQDF